MVLAGGCQGFRGRLVRDGLAFRGAVQGMRGVSLRCSQQGEGTSGAMVYLSVYLGLSTLSRLQVPDHIVCDAGHIVCDAGHAVCGSDHIMRDRDRRLCGVGQHDATLDGIRCTGDVPLKKADFGPYNMRCRTIQYAMPDHVLCPQTRLAARQKAYSNQKNDGLSWPTF